MSRKKNVLKENAKEIEKLVKLVQRGEQEAFAKIYDYFVDPLYRYIYYRVNSADAEDLLETVFLKAWENINQYTKGKFSFSSWIFRIAHNLVVDYYRMNKKNTSYELPMHLETEKREHNPIKVTENTLNQGVLKDAIAKLKKHYQEVIIHKFINGFSNKEMAKMMNKTEGSIRILQFRALKALKKELELMGVSYKF